MVTRVACVFSLLTLSTSVGRAQVVQLPTFHYFTVNTTVSVPDRGSVYLGGVKRGAIRSSSRGIPG